LLDLEKAKKNKFKDATEKSSSSNLSRETAGKWPPWLQPNHKRLMQVLWKANK